MATYYAVVGLLEDIEQLLSPYNRSFRWSEKVICPITRKEIQILYDAVILMDSFLRDSSIDQALENRIASLVRKAGHRVDLLALSEYQSRIGIKIRGSKEGESFTQITQEAISINYELEKIHDSSSSADKPYCGLSRLRTIPTTEGKLVGLENDLVTMLDSLTGQPSQLKVFSIIGMAGIGKTTFSKKLYDDPLVIYHFYIRAWVTVSQQYQERKVLLTVVHCLTNDDPDEIHGRSTEELREKVYRILKGKRYLLVLDDMWDTTAWDDLKRIFPDDNNGSRIILTSRLRDVALHASGGTPPHCLRCLNRYESWELLSSKILEDESCHKELVEVGKKIAYNCHGLPLTLVVVGGLLSKMNKKLDVWEQVAQSVGSVVIEDAEQCYYVLALSYNHLPNYLKLCFLYMGMFPEDYDISVKELIWLWVAEGFIRPATTSTTLKSLEEVAEDYLADLIARSLILVKRRGSDGKIKTCYIHDLMRELCLRESQEHKFLHVINHGRQLPMNDEAQLRGNIPSQSYSYDLQRLSFQSSLRKYSHKTSLPFTRSLMSFEKLSVSGPVGYFGQYSELLKVLNIININLIEIPIEILILTELKFLAITVQSPLNIWYIYSRYNHLQTLIIDCEWDGYLSSTFWDMLELRHFHLKRSCQSYSSTYSGSSQLPPSFLSAPVQETLPRRVLNNLKSVSTIRPISCTEKIFRSMPHLKSLGVYESEDDYEFRGWFKRLVLLPQLEKLKYIFSNPFVSSVLKPDRLPPWHSFPPKLMKLTLSGTSLPWDDMSNLSMLPKLEVLKLRNYAFSGAVWKSTTGGFRCLKQYLRCIRTYISIIM